MYAPQFVQVNPGFQSDDMNQNPMNHTFVKPKQSHKRLRTTEKSIPDKDLTNTNKPSKNSKKNQQAKIDKMSSLIFVAQQELNQFLIEEAELEIKQKNWKALINSEKIRLNSTELVDTDLIQSLHQFDKIIDLSPGFLIKMEIFELCQATVDKIIKLNKGNGSIHLVLAHVYSEGKYGIEVDLSIAKRRCKSALKCALSPEQKQEAKTILCAVNMWLGVSHTKRQARFCSQSIVTGF